jgi:lipid A 4'-phosphatase
MAVTGIRLGLGLRLWLAGALLAGLLFTWFPSIDLRVSHWFWTSADGFFLKDWAPFRLAHEALPVLTWILVILLLALLGFVILAERGIGVFDRRHLLFLLLSLALGPGLFTNTILKDHWGRARPSQVTEFGGANSFTPALLPAAQCDRNCSFVSGDGAMAFSLVGFGFLPWRRARRRLIIGAALSFGAFISLARIAQGGHFLSDTIFAALLASAVVWVTHLLVVKAGLFEQAWLRRAAHLAAGDAASAISWLAAGSRQRWRRWLGFDLLCAGLIAASVLWLDRPIAFLFAMSGDRLFHWLRAIGDLGLGVYWLVGSGVPALLLILLSRARRFAAARERFAAWALVPGFVFLSVALSGLTADLVKILVGRTRPKLFLTDGFYDWGGLAWHADHWSFPSGHVANAAGLAVALYCFWPRHVLAYGAFVVLVALGRIGTDQHFLSDTIGSVWIAALVVFYLRGVVIRLGIRFADAKAGVIPPRPARSAAAVLAPWRSGSP